MAKRVEKEEQKIVIDDSFEAPVMTEVPKKEVKAE